MRKTASEVASNINADAAMRAGYQAKQIDIRREVEGEEAVDDLRRALDVSSIFALGSTLNGTGASVSLKKKTNEAGNEENRDKGLFADELRYLLVQKIFYSSVVVESDELSVCLKDGPMVSIGNPIHP